MIRLTNVNLLRVYLKMMYICRWEVESQGVTNWHQSGEQVAPRRLGLIADTGLCPLHSQHVVKVSRFKGYGHCPQVGTGRFANHIANMVTGKGRNESILINKHEQYHANETLNIFIFVYILQADRETDLHILTHMCILFMSYTWLYIICIQM